MYRQQHSLPSHGTLTCPECGSTRFRITFSKAICTNCDYSVKTGNNKYGAVRTVANDGIKRDSKYEATVADSLLFRKKTKDIKDYDSQFKIEAWACRSDGTPAFKVSHKVDFRIHHNDGSFELLEAKGKETDDYRWRRKFLEHIWLPDHPDHIYTVVKQNPRR